MTFSGALPSPRERHLRRSVPRSVFVALISLPSSIFLTRTIVIVKACVLVFGLWSSAFDVAVVG